MLKKTIKYTDFNGEERTEDFRFHLTKAELMDMQSSVPGGFAGLVEKIIQTKDTPAIITMFKEIIAKSYGEKSLDGRLFNKSPEIFDNFKSTEAYSELFMQLATDTEAATEFIRGIVPTDLETKPPQISHT